MGSFVAGHLVPVSWNYSLTAKPPAELNVKETSLDLSVLLHDVTGVKANGVRARIAGPFDVAGRVVCDLDLDEVPWDDAVNVFPGFKGIMKYGVSPHHRIELPLICEKLHTAGATDREVSWDADWKCNSLAGTVVFPAM